MPRQFRVPSYRLHKPTRQTVVRIAGRDFYLGKHGNEESHEAYQRLIAEWLTHHRPPDHLRPTGRPQLPQAGLSVNELILAFWRHYVKNGRQTDELHCYRSALRHVRALYGHTIASEFGPLRMETVRRLTLAAFSGTLYG
jgi:hypothetical protein